MEAAIIIMAVVIGVLGAIILILGILLGKMSTVLVKQDDRADSFNEYCGIVADDLREIQKIILNHEFIDVDSKRILNEKMDICIKELNLEQP